MSNTNLNKISEIPTISRERLIFFTINDPGCQHKKIKILFSVERTLKYSGYLFFTLFYSLSIFEFFS